ncbi:MAG: hypothetical protein IJU81_02545 [Bacteroidales bacterium]|nr:hypothetical protein [Bacteroidales bacterium]
MKQILFRADGLALSVNALPTTLDLSAEAKVPALQPRQDTPVDNQDPLPTDNQDTKRHHAATPATYLHLRIAGLALTSILIILTVIRIARQK